MRHEMKKAVRMWVAMLAVVMLLGGCATATLPDDATNAEKRAALCQDAIVGLATADAAMHAAKPGSDEMRYWKAFRAGALIAQATYCVVSK